MTYEALRFLVDASGLEVVGCGSGWAIAAGGGSVGGGGGGGGGGEGGRGGEGGVGEGGQVFFVGARRGRDGLLW